MGRPKKRRNKKNLQLTNNSREYKMTKRRLDLGCPLCPPNKGCNRRYKNGSGYRCWKRYRKNQWKE